MDSDYGITSLTGLSMISHSTSYLLTVLVGVSSVKGLSEISCSIFLTYGTHGRCNWFGSTTYMSENGVDDIKIKRKVSPFFSLHSFISLSLPSFLCFSPFTWL